MNRILYLIPVVGAACFVSPWQTRLHRNLNGNISNSRCSTCRTQILSPFVPALLQGREKQSISRQTASTILLSNNSEETVVIDTEQETDSEEKPSEVKASYYKSPDGWKKRIQLNELEVGQQLSGEKVPRTDLLNGKTGPKMFFECGVGRVDSKGRWKMVNAMLRLGKNNKPSKIHKRVKRLSAGPVELFVYKIRMDHGMLEVLLSEEALDRELAKDSSKSIVSAASLQVGQELIGKVVELRSYGCLVDVGANRRGLLHIQKVADLYGKYIDKEKGLENAGLEKGAEIRVAVASNEKKNCL